jgi:hypothetical protein
MRSLHKWIFGLLLVLIFLLASLQWIIEPWLESKAHEWLHQNQTLSGKAKVIDLHIFSRSLSVDSLHLNVKQSHSNSIVQEFSLSIPRLKISGIAIWPLLFQEKIDISELIVNKIQIEALKKRSSQSLDVKRDSLNKVPFHAFRIRQFLMDSLDAVFMDSINNTSIQTGINLIEGALGMSMDKKDGLQITPGHTRIFIDETKMKLPSGYYELTFKKCKLRGDKASFTLDSLKIHPLLKKYAFSQKYGYRTDRMLTQITSIDCSGLDVSRLLEDQYLKTQLFQLKGMDLNIFRDARLPIHPEKRTVLLQKMLKQLPIAFAIDSLLVEEGRIRYEERKLDDQGIGHLLFENIFIKGGLLSNDSSLVRHEVFSPKASAVFMGKGELDVDFQFPLDKMNGYHRVSGNLGPMAIEEVNTILYPLTTFKIKSGFNENVYFNMELDETDAKGDMQFYYRNLNVEIGSEEQDWINDVATFLANRIVIKENPKNDKFRPGNISYTRDPKRSIFNYWWKSLRSGILGSVGLSSEVVK